MKSILTLSLILFTFSAFSQKNIMEEKELKWPGDTIKTPPNLINSSPEIFSPYNISSYELIGASIKYSDASIGFTPTQLFRANAFRYFDLKIKLSQKDKITTLTGGAGIYLHGGRLIKIFDKLLEPYRYPATSTHQQRIALAEAFESKTDSLIDVAYKTNAKWNLRLSVSRGAQFYDVLDGDKEDRDGDGKKENFYYDKSQTTSIGFVLGVTQRFTLTGAFNNSPRRASAIEGSLMTSYRGFSLGASGLAFTFNKSYKKTADYKDTGFIPGLELGLIYEYLRFTDRTENIKNAENGLLKQFAITPTIDVRVNQKMQFRIGLPVKKATTFDAKKDLVLSPILQYTLQLSTL